MSKSRPNNHQRLSALLQSNAEVAVVIDVDGTILDVTANAGRADQHIDHSTAIGETIDTVFPAEAAEELDDSISRALETGIEPFDYQAPTQTGTRRFNGYLTPIHPDEEQSAVIWVAEDVTDRERHAERRKIHAHALESALSGIAIADLDGNLLSVNEAFLDLWGYDSEDAVLDTAVTSYWTQPDAAADVVAALEETGHWNGTLRAIRADGTTFPAKCAASIVTDEADDPIAMMSSFVDISERRAARTAIRRKNELLTQTEQLADVGGWELDLETETLTWTDGTRRVHEVSPEYQPTHQAAIDFYHTYDRERIQQAVEQCRENGTPFDLEARIVTANGRTRWVRTSGQRITRDGHPYLQGAIRDVTERKNREQRLMVMYRVLRHNLRNALNVVTGHAGHIRRELRTLLPPGTNDGAGTIETLLDRQDRLKAKGEEEQLETPMNKELSERLESFSAEAIREDVQKIEQTSADLLDLVEKTREFERSYDGDGERVAVSARGILEDVREVFHHRYPTASIEVVGPDATVQAMTGQLYPVVEELVENAIEHSDRERPSVTLRIETDEPRVEAATEPGRVVLKVEDTGPGIPDQERKAIERAAETSLVHATGLGLWQVYWLVTQLGGTLTFEDNEPRGTVVTIELPASREGRQ